MTPQLDELVVSDAAAGRWWLSGHHDNSPGVWLVLHKAGGSVTALTCALRAEECLDLLLALNAGLPGMCTIHANSAREALVEMCTLPLLAGENIPSLSGFRAWLL